MRRIGTALRELHTDWWEGSENALVHKSVKQRQKRWKETKGVVTVDVTHARHMEPVWTNAAKNIGLPLTSSKSKSSLVILCDGARRELDAAALVMPAGSRSVVVSKLNGSFRLMSKASLSQRIKLLEKFSRLALLQRSSEAAGSAQSPTTGPVLGGSIVTVYGSRASCVASAPVPPPSRPLRHRWWF